MFPFARTILSSALFLALSTPQVPSPAAARMVKEFKSKNLGIYDVSSDGALLLMHEDRKSNLKRSVFKARVLKAENYVEVASVEVEVPRGWETKEDEDYSNSRQIFFMPQSHRVILVGKLKKSDAPALLVWDPEKGTFDRIPKLLNGRTFLADAWDADRLLYYTLDSPRSQAIANARGRRFFLYSLSTRQSEAISIRDEEYRFETTPPVVRSPDGSKIIGRVVNAENLLDIRDFATGSIHRLEIPQQRSITNYAYSPDGKYLSLISIIRVIVPGTENGTRGQTDLPFLSLYDVASARFISDQRILEHIVPYAKKVAKLPAAENYLVSTGQLMRFSHDSRLLALSFCIGSRNSGRQSAQFALFRFPAFELAAIAQHPEVKIGVHEFVGGSAAGGRLHFSGDNGLLFTTSKYTIAWDTKPAIP